MKNIELLAGENSSRTTSENEASSAGIGVSFSPQGLSGLSLSASKAQGNSKENASTYTPTEIAAKDTLHIESGKDTNILGSTVQGDKVTAKIGTNLHIETLQEKETYEEKNTSAGFDLSWDIRAGKFSKPTFGLSAGRGTIDSHYRSARGQSGIFAGKGGSDIYVEKNTDLKGAVIASEADAGKNRLSTGTFSFSDLENGADYSSKSIGAEYHHYGSYDKMSRQEKNKIYNTIGLSPSLSMPAKGDANSTTTSAVAPGTIDIRKNPTQDISALSRDTANSLNELGRIFDKQKIEEQQELAKAFGEEAFRLAHNLPDDGSGRKVAVHAIIGGIMSQITGVGFASGAIGAGVNEAVIGEIKKIKDPGTAQIVSAIVGAAAATAVSGNAAAGANAAASGTKSNAYRERPNYEGAFVVRDNQIFIISNGEEVPYEGDIPYNAYFWVEDSNAPWYGWDYKRTDVGDFYEPRIPTHMFYFSHENRIYGLTFLDDTNGQKKAEVNELGLKLADTLLNYRIAGAAPLIKIPITLISGAKDKNWDIDPRNIPSKFENLIDTIWEYFADN